MTSQKGQRALGGILAAVLLPIVAGCHSSASGGVTSSAPPSAANSAADKASSIQTIQDNPNIPPQQKANIIAQINGRRTSTTAPVSAHP